MPEPQHAEELRLRRRSMLGRRVRELRVAKGLTQEQLAEQTGYDRKWVVRIETATHGPAVDRLFVLADALGVTASGLLEDID